MYKGSSDVVIFLSVIKSNLCHVSPSVTTTLTEVMMSAYILSIPIQYASVSSVRRLVTFTNTWKPTLPVSTMWDRCLYRVLATPSESSSTSQVFLEAPRHQYFLLYRKLWWYLQAIMNSPPICALISFLSHWSWRLAARQTCFTVTRKLHVSIEVLGLLGISSNLNRMQVNISS